VGVGFLAGHFIYFRSVKQTISFLNRKNIIHCSLPTHMSIDISERGERMRKVGM
jgi:hypothetical protein